MKKVEGGVTAASGFLAAGIAAGIKKSGKKDMALVYSKVPAVTAGVFTTNVVKAAPVKWDMNIVKTRETVRAVVLNSGIANACTGIEGEKANEVMAMAMAKALSISEKEEILTASTGVIGQPLPLEAIKKGAVLLAEAMAGGAMAASDAATAIMTTDITRKECAVEFMLGAKTVTIGGMTKGSGMIHPNMATMLCTVTTDAAISKEMLQEALSRDVKKTFNQISVDRDTSTNDTYLILANGLAGNPTITQKNEDFDTFCKALNLVTTKLAKKMAADGEGATKLLEVKVIHAASEEEAQILSKSVISSNLVKTAVYGSDANWGRIFCAMGYSGVTFNPDIVDLFVESGEGKLKLVENGMMTAYSEELATKILSGKEVTAIADMKSGEYEAAAWGCDLTYDYVKINGDYRS